MNSSLDAFWHVVAYSSAIGDKPVAVEYMLQRVLLWRDGMKLVALADRCPHRGARLSQGTLNAGLLRCPYHGWEFDSAGKCRRIPGQEEIPNRAQVEGMRVAESDGFVWIAAAETGSAMPPRVDWSSRIARRIPCGPYVVRAWGTRVVENFLDLHHLPFVHGGTLGTPDTFRFPVCRVSTTPRSMEVEPVKVIQPNPDGTGAEHDVEYRYSVIAPLVAVFHKEFAAQTFSVALAAAPIGDRLTKAFMMVGLSEGFSMSDDEVRAFQDGIVAQDVAIVESQEPPLPGGPSEVHSRSDAVSLLYRRWLKGQGVTYGLWQA